MKDWVKTFLNNQFICMGEVNEHNIYSELAYSLNIDFGKEGYHIENQNVILDFIDIFGSVLADLPENVFKKLYEMKNLFFIFTPCPMSEVKVFKLKKDMKEKESLTIVNFPYTSYNVPVEGFENFSKKQLIRGEIVHEIAHVYKGCEIRSPEIEFETDEIAKSWGFKKEIEAKETLIQYWFKKEMKGGETE